MTAVPPVHRDDIHFSPVALPHSVQASGKASAEARAAPLTTRVAAAALTPPTIRVKSKTVPMSGESRYVQDSPRWAATSADGFTRPLSQVPVTALLGNAESVERMRPGGDPSYRLVSSSVPALSTLLRRQFAGGELYPSPSSLALASARIGASPPLLPHLDLPSPTRCLPNTGAQPRTQDAIWVTHGRDYADLLALVPPATLDTTFSLTDPSVAEDGAEEELPTESPVLVDTPRKSAGHADSDQFAVSACGYFLDTSVVDSYSLLELYRIRCWQLGLKRPDPRVEAQLPLGVGRSATLGLFSIDLSSTYVGSAGCLALAAVIPFCTALRSVTLSGVGLVENSLPVFSLLRACRCCHHLFFLDLSLNRLGDIAGRWLLWLCRERLSLRVVRVEQACLSEPLMRKLQRCLHARDAPSTTSTDATQVDRSRTSPVALRLASPSVTPWGSRSLLPPPSEASSCRLSPPHHRGIESPTPSSTSARTRLSYATPVRARLGPDGHPDETCAVGYELLGSSGALSRLGRSSERVTPVNTITSVRTPTPPAPINSVLFGDSASVATSGEPVSPPVLSPGEPMPAEPAEIAAWIHEQRAKERIAASLKHATNEELYDHSRQEDLDHASHCHVPEFVAAALVELRRRLARNGHAMRRIYDCFLLPDEFEAEVKMGSAGMMASGEVARLTRRHTRTDHRRRQHDILRSSATQQHKAEALVHMELMQSDNVSPELVKQVHQGVCSWKAFFRGLRILGIDSAATDLQQATRFASACGILTVDHVCFGQLLRLLRPHVDFTVPAASAGGVASSTIGERNELPRVASPRPPSRHVDGPRVSSAGPRWYSHLSSARLAPTPLSGSGDSSRSVGVGGDAGAASPGASLETSYVAATSPRGSASSRARVITWDASAPARVCSSAALTDFSVPPPRVETGAGASVPSGAAPSATDGDEEESSAVASTTAAIQVVLDKLFDARHALRRALAATVLDPNHYSTLLLQTIRSLDLGQPHDTVQSDEWIVLERSPATVSLPRLSLCQWPQTDLLERQLDSTVNQWRRASLQRASLSAGDTEATVSRYAAIMSPPEIGLPLPETGSHVDTVRLSATYETALSPLNTHLPMLPGTDLAHPRAKAEVGTQPFTTPNTESALLVPYSSVLQTCVAALGGEYTDVIRTVLCRCFSGHSPFVNEELFWEGLLAPAAGTTASFHDDDDRLVDVEKNLFQCLTLRSPPPAPPADEERANWRALTVADLQRLVQNA